MESARRKRRQRRRGLLVWAAICLPVALRLALVPWTGVPQPVIHDEFSYLLAADTFASGRLANPPHPFADHFTALHVLQQPTYASKYFPGQGLFLAAGQVVTGEPWAGVLLGMTLFMGAAAWMLLGWLPWRWAIAAMALLLLRLGPQHYWWNSYWGGGLPAAGGALVLGALPRILRRPTLACALAGGLGVGLLALTRPHEGLWLTLSAAAAAAVVLIRRHTRLPWKTALAAGLIVLPFLGFLGLYNHQVVGSAWTLPYMVYEREQGAWPIALWAQPRPMVQHPHEMIRQVGLWWRDYQRTARTAPALLHRTRRILDLPFGRGDLHPVDGRLQRTLFGLLLLAAAPWLARDRRLRVPLLLGIVGVLVLLTLICYFEHYGAPWVAIKALLIAEGARRAYAWWRRRHPRPRAHPADLLALAALAVTLAGAAYQVATADRPAPPERRIADDRPRITRELLSCPGPDLVFVHFGPRHDIHQHWTYNAADIDHAPIIWAWEMGPDRDRELIDRYPERSIWRCEPDARPCRLTQLR